MLKDWFAKPEKPKVKGYKGWVGELTPTQRMGHWDLKIRDPEGNLWGYRGQSWSIYGPKEAQAVRQARKKVRALADQEIAKAEWAKREKRVI